MNGYCFRLVMGLMLVWFWCAPAAADYQDDIGYTALENELGASLLTGAGVKVTQIEAASGEPNPSDAEFAGKTFTYKTSLTVSSHATAVGEYFYGLSSSMTSGITSITCYDSVNWRSSFLGSGTSAPLISSSRVANHSYISTSTSTSNISYLARMDWVVARDEYIQVVAMNNGGTTYPLMASSFNAISVGLSNGTAASGSYPLTTTTTTPYASASTRPDIVVPMSATSYATPVVASAAALLVDLGHTNTSLSKDPLVNSTTNRNGDTVYNAERSEVVKAALMAGADRTATQLATTYTVNTANGLNSTYGAGQLNIYNSYHIIAAGEQNSLEDYAAGGGEITATGFDYDPYFGGKSGSNRTGTYTFTATSTGTLAASLVWNLSVTGDTNGTFDTTATLYHLGLYLYDLTTSTEVAYAASLVDNTENIWTSLTAGHSYELEVMALDSSNFLWDYALAWDITSTTTHAPLPGTLFLLGSGLVAVIILRRKSGNQPIE
jgi:hypothetical protein